MRKAPRNLNYLHQECARNSSQLQPCALEDIGLKVKFSDTPTALDNQLQSLDE